MDITIVNKNVSGSKYTYTQRRCFLGIVLTQLSDFPKNMIGENNLSCELVMEEFCNLSKKICCKCDNPLVIVQKQDDYNIGSVCEKCGYVYIIDRIDNIVDNLINLTITADFHIKCNCETKYFQGISMKNIINSYRFLHTFPFCGNCYKKRKHILLKILNIKFPNFDVSFIFNKIWKLMIQMESPSKNYKYPFF